MEIKIKVSEKFWKDFYDMICRDTLPRTCKDCDGCGLYLIPRSPVGKYPKGTKLSQMQFSEPEIGVCECMVDKFPNLTEWLS